MDEGGVTGEENNSDIPNYQNNAEDELNSDNTPHYDRETEWIDPGYVLTQTEKEQGVVKSATISVVVTTENAYLSRDERNAVIQLVKNATNINEENISVYSRESGKLPVAAGDESITSKLGLDTKKLIILLGLCGFVFLAVALIVIFMIIRSMKKKNEKGSRRRMTLLFRGYRTPLMKITEKPLRKQPRSIIKRKKRLR